MDSNGDLLKRVVWTAFVLGKYDYYKNILKKKIETYDDLINEEEFEKFAKYRKENELSCKMHIPVVLGITSDTKIVDIENGKVLHSMYRRCLCCGRYLNYDSNLPYEIDATNYKTNLNDSKDALDAKFYDILETFSHYATDYDKLDEIIYKFKLFLDNYRPTVEEQTKTFMDKLDNDEFIKNQTESYKRQKIKRQ